MVASGKLRPTCPDKTPVLAMTLVEWCSNFDTDKRPSFEQVCDYFKNHNSAGDQTTLIPSQQLPSTVGDTHKSDYLNVVGDNSKATDVHQFEYV
jgi:hypothetical protein